MSDAATCHGGGSRLQRTGAAQDAAKPMRTGPDGNAVRPGRRRAAAASLPSSAMVCRCAGPSWLRRWWDRQATRAKRWWAIAGDQGAGLPAPPRRRLAASRSRPNPPRAPNHVWAYDFVFDACANGQQIKCLTIVDEFTHEALAIDVAGSIRSARVIDVLARLITLHGPPAFLRSDNGPEFVSHAVLNWLEQTSIGTAHIDPGSPWQNGTNESFHGKLRDECLNLEWFRSRREAAVIIEAWRQHYNAVRPHSSIAYLTPLEFKQQHSTTPNRAILQE